MRLLAGLVRLIDSVNEMVGRCVSWLTVFMVVNVFVVVVLRYVFSIGWIWMQEMYVWAHGAVFMLGAGYTLLHDGHVRIDVIYRGASARYQALVNLFGSVFFAMPVIWIIYSKGLSYVLRSWKGMESSPEAGGLPGLFLLKGVILAFCILFALQFLSLALRSVLTLLGHDVPPHKDGSSQPTEEAA